MEEERENRKRTRIGGSRDKEVKVSQDGSTILALLVLCFYWEPKENEREIRGKERGKVRERECENKVPKWIRFGEKECMHHVKRKTGQGA